MASKRGPLSKAEVFYVTEHAKAGKEINDIANDLDRPAKSIEKCYTQAKAKADKPCTTGDQLARSKGCVVMTENASAMSDATKQSYARPCQKHCTTKIKED